MGWCGGGGNGDIWVNSGQGVGIMGYGVVVVFGIVG